RDDINPHAPVPLLANSPGMIAARNIHGPVARAASRLPLTSYSRPRYPRTAPSVGKHRRFSAVLNPSLFPVIRYEKQSRGGDCTFPGLDATAMPCDGEVHLYRPGSVDHHGSRAVVAGSVSNNRILSGGE